MRKCIQEKEKKERGLPFLYLRLLGKLVIYIQQKSPSAKRIYEYQEVLMCNF
jgi:hypothetical protein